MTKEVSIRENRDFKGVWIPRELYENTELSWNEKIILIEIDSLSKNGECFASNQHFADLLGISKKRVEALISELRKNGYISSIVKYKTGSKEVEKRILHVADPHTFSNQIPYPQKQGEGILENEDAPTLENEGDKNTYTNNTFEESKDINTKESIPEDMLYFPSVERDSGDWRWKSSKQYIAYIEKVMPKYIREIASEWGKDSDNAYMIFLDIFKRYFEQYRIYNDSFHPWYRKETIKEVIDSLFKHFGKLNCTEVREYMEQFFSHEKLRCKPMKVFASENMLSVLENEITGDWSEAMFN